MLEHDSNGPPPEVCHVVGALGCVCPLDQGLLHTGDGLVVEVHGHVFAEVVPLVERILVEIGVLNF